jgi:hypothetical protein
MTKPQRLPSALIPSNVVRPAILCATIVAASLVVPLRGGQVEPKPAVRQTGKLEPRITVSLKTTRILRPLRGDGYVDYVAALNQTVSQGVTPENNAGAWFVRGLALSDLKPAARAQVFKLLKIDPVPERGEYLTGFDEFVQKKLGRPATKQEQADYSTASKEPWSASEFPLVAEWLASQSRPLELIVEGTRCPKCYIPLVAGHMGLIAAPLPVVQASRTAARALAARGLLRLREGKIGEAEEDLLACHRLGRLIGAMPSLIGALTGIAIDEVAFQGDHFLMQDASLPARDALAYQQKLCNLPSLPAMADLIDGPERFMLLDTISIIARDQQEAPRGVPNTVLRNFWDEILQIGNAQFDKAVAAARQSTAPERKQAFGVLDRELQVMRSEVGELGDFAFLMSQGRTLRNLVSRQVGKALTVSLMPAVGVACEAETRAHTREALGQLGFALAAYRADHADYPESLNVLAPRYIARVPRDLFNEQPLHYKRQADGFLLYSVGANARDDGGSTFASQPSGDDIVLRISRRSPRKR